MLSANEIKRIRSLREKKFRDRLGLFVVEGEKMVEEALKSRFPVEEVYRREEIGAEAMQRISALSSPSPVLAVVRKPADLPLAEAGEMLQKGLYLALDGLRDPGNVGTILRIADWFGIQAALASEDTVDVFNPKVVQATMGAIFRIPFHYTDIPAACRAAVSRKGTVYGAFLKGESIYREPLSNGEEAPVLLVIGNESDGISPQTAAEVTSKLFIPPYPPHAAGPESLNAAAATAIALSEFRRRL